MQLHEDIQHARTLAYNAITKRWDAATGQPPPEDPDSDESREWILTYRAARRRAAADLALIGHWWTSEIVAVISDCARFPLPATPPMPDSTDVEALLFCTYVDDPLLVRRQETGTYAVVDGQLYVPADDEVAVIRQDDVLYEHWVTDPAAVDVAEALWDISCLAAGHTGWMLPTATIIEDGLAVRIVVPDLTMQLASAPPEAMSTWVSLHEATADEALGEQGWVRLQEWTDSTGGGNVIAPLLFLPALYGPAQ